MKTKRIVIILLTVMLLSGLWVSAAAANTEADAAALPEIAAEPASDGDAAVYADEDVVRVSIVLEGLPTTAAYSLTNIAANGNAMAYRHSLQRIQTLVTQNIETYALGGKKLDVVWNLTLVANAISANVEYGKLDEIAAMDGVVDVFVEQRVYPDVMETMGAVEPAMLGSSTMTGSALAHASGYTGAGSRVAVIDTGIDTDHRSFDAGAFEYSLRQLEKRGLITLDSLDLMTADTIKGVFSELNISSKDVTAEELYVSSKLPFAFNYAEPDYGVNHHKGDGATGHGSHVAGIAAANTYVPSGDGTYAYALEEVGVQGMAPDAQILTLRVFNRVGGCYESDYMVAIEDAILLGADSINLSLGSTVIGFHRSTLYEDILDNLVKSGTVCVASAGNSGAWGDYGKLNGNILSEDVNFSTGGSPASYSATFAVGSVDNSDTPQAHFTVDGQWVFYNAGDTSLASLAGAQTYVVLPGDPAEADTLRSLLEGKIAVYQRGGNLSLSEMVNRAAQAGATALVLVNNEDGTLNIALSAPAIPVVTVTKADGALLKTAAQTIDGSDTYYQGTLTVVESEQKEDSYTMSFFSSFGVPGDIALSPDIAAPGGSINSVNGEIVGGQAYEVLSGTSMAGPQVAGMSATLAQYVRDKKLTSLNYTAPFLIQNLLMSTSVPFIDATSHSYWPVLQQGSGLANLDHALSAQALILMDHAATAQAGEGRVKAEFGDDPTRSGSYSYDFTIKNFSGKANSYALSTQLFTQDLLPGQELSNGEIATFLAKTTVPLSADVTYTVGGQSVTTVTVAAYGSASVHVDITLTDKGMLEAYPNGAYVEGYTFIKGLADGEGVKDVEYSIPLLGFYGRWSDASMYDHATYAGKLYGENTISYIFGQSSDTNPRLTNYLNIKDPTTGETRIYTGNPYVIATDIGHKTDRGAIRSTDIIQSYTASLIRNAAAGAIYWTDAQGALLGMGNVRTQIEAAICYKGTWSATSRTISFNRTPAQMGLEEGTTFQVNLVTVPEYYEKGGPITAEQLRSMVEDGTTLGPGAFLSTTLTVDDTPPEIIEVEREGDTLIVTAQDNQYIAYMAVTNRSGSVVYGSYVPKESKNAEVTYTFNLEGVDMGPTCRVFVGDYAKNETVRYFDYGEEYPSLEGKLGGYIHSGGGDYQSSWAVIDPSTMTAAGVDMEPSAHHGGATVTAAAYVDGYVYQVIGSKLYVSSIDEIDALIELVDLERFKLHSVRALSYNVKNNTLYALTEGNTLWSIDPKNGYAKELAEITVDRLNGDAGRITAMAIDKDGHFYGVTYYTDSSSPSLFLQWDLDATTDGPLTLTGTSLSGVTLRDRYGSMTYDREEGALYLAESYNNNTSYSQNRLLRIDPATHTVTSSTLKYAVRGLFAVPTTDDDHTLDAPKNIQALDILPDNLKMFVSGIEDLSPLITPWTAENQDLQWSVTGDPAVTVENGVVTAVAVGKATVTVTSAADSGVSDSCVITVEPIPDIQVSSLVYKRDATGYIAQYSVADPAHWESLSPLSSDYTFYSGGLSNGKLYVHDGSWIYIIDPQAYTVTQGPIFHSLGHAWSDATQAPKNTLLTIRDVVGLCSNGTQLATYTAKSALNPLVSSVSLGAPAAAVAYIDEDDKGIAYYYLLLENGALYYVSTATNPVQGELIGVLPGIDLSGVSKANRDVTASMHYDAKTEYLILTHHTDRTKATVHIIDPKTARVMTNKDFEDDVRYAVALYQYDPAEASAALSPQAATTSAYSDGLEYPIGPEGAVQETHSVYEGLEVLLTAPIARPYAVGGMVAQVNSTGLTYSTLQEAINAAHALIITGDHDPQTVKLLADTTESVRDVWIRGHIDYDYDLTIDLNGYTVTGTGTGPVLWFESGGTGGAAHGYLVTVTDTSPEQTGAITGGTGRARTYAGTSGGGIYFSASNLHDKLTISGGTIEDNTVSGSGGAIAMDGRSAAQLVIDNTTIRSNTAKNGALSGRWITLTGGEVTGNQATGIGGGLYLWSAGTQELLISDNAYVYDNHAGVMGDDVAVASLRGSAAYSVTLNDPDNWSGAGENTDWYMDGMDGPYGSGSIQRFDPDSPDNEKLSSLTVSHQGLAAPAYAIAAKLTDFSLEDLVFTVTYQDGADGEAFQAEVFSDLHYGDDTPGFTPPARPGYTFQGWEPTPVQTVTRNATYTAQWAEIPVESVTLDETDLSLNEGVSVTLRATVLPGTALHQIVAWRMEGPEGVVDITSGGNTLTVTARTAGTATIVAELDGQTASCTVTVSHVWGTPTFAWQETEDGYQATAQRQCAVGHTEEAAATVTVQITQPATCTQPGEAAYTASASFDGTNYTAETTGALPPTGHSYTAYTYDNNATYLADGTETAECDNGCGTKDTRTATGTKLEDNDAPAVTVTVGGDVFDWFGDAPSFAYFYKEPQTVSIAAQDSGSGQPVVFYYLSHTPLSREELDELDQWTPYEDSFTLSPDDVWIVYVKATDLVGNTAYCSAGGLVLDATPPTFVGSDVPEDNGVYCVSKTITVADAYFDRVEVNGDRVSVTALEEGWQLTLTAGEYTVTVYDKAGNTLTVQLTVREEHQFAEITRVEPTCSVKGSVLEVCDFCGERLETDLGYADHLWGAAVFQWSQDGAEAWAVFTCENEASHTQTVTGSVTAREKQPATCTENGVTEYTATVAFEGETYRDTIELADIPAAHMPVIDPEKAPTCTETGLTEGSHCSVCGEILVAQETVEATGHQWDSGVVTTAPSATEDGIRTYTCTVCQETRTEPIPATGEKPGDNTGGGNTGGGTTGGGNTGGGTTGGGVGGGGIGGTGGGGGGGTGGSADDTKVIIIRDEDGEVIARVELPATIPALGYRFEDVPAGHWAESSINAMAALGVVQGVSSTGHIFDMNSNITRGAMAQILFNLSHGKAGLTTSFHDVAPGAWYSNAVAWAASVGIVTGYSADVFGPTDTITRQQLATMLYRYAALLKQDVSADRSNVLGGFVDGYEVAPWASDAVTWAVSRGLIQGRGAAVLDPDAPATRAETAAIFTRFIALVK